MKRRKLQKNSRFQLRSSKKFKQKVAKTKLKGGEKMEAQVQVKIPKEDLVKAVREILAENGMSFQQENEWMNATEARKYLGVSSYTFYQWINKGRIPYSMIDGVKRYSKTELSKAMKRNQF